MHGNDKTNIQLSKSLLRELPFYNVNNLVLSQVFSPNNSWTTKLPTIKNLDNYPSMCDLGLFNLNTASDANPNVNLNQHILRSQYYSPHKFNSLKKSQSNCITDTSFSMLTTHLFEQLICANFWSVMLMPCDVIRWTQFHHGVLTL